MMRQLLCVVLKPAVQLLLLLSLCEIFDGLTHISWRLLLFRDRKTNWPLFCWHALGNRLSLVLLLQILAGHFVDHLIHNQFLYLVQIILLLILVCLAFSLRGTISFLTERILFYCGRLWLVRICLVTAVIDGSQQFTRLSQGLSLERQVLHIESINLVYLLDSVAIAGAIRKVVFHADFKAELRDF